MSDAPIGIFDSGLGGLSAVKQMLKILPHENIIYFGDTGRVPYGSKSIETIRKYTKQDINFLLSKNVKMIVAACGTVSSVAGDIGESLSVPFTGVLKPTVLAAVNATKNDKIGIIGTSATIKSQSYNREILSIRPDIQVFSKDCPLFVPLVENGFTCADDQITKLAVEFYLKDLKETGVDTVILGCTHYPIIKTAIGEYLGEKVKLIDAGKETAHYCKRLLQQHDIENHNTENGKSEFYVSDTPDSFKSIAKIFLKQNISDRVHKVELFC